MNPATDTSNQPPSTTRPGLANANDASPLTQPSLALGEHLAGDRADATTMKLYRFLEGASAADQLFVFRNLPMPRCSVSPERAHLAINALLACQADYGDGAFSRRRYDAWRDIQEDPAEWPSSSFIRRCFRSWSGSLDAAGIAPAPDVGARNLRVGGRMFTDEQLERALKLFARDVPADGRNSHSYAEWAKSFCSDPSNPDIPRSEQAFIRRYGGFSEALITHDLVTPDKANSLRSRLASCRYASKEMAEALRRCADDCGARVISRTRYDTWAKAERNAGRHAPGACTITKRFGGWRDAHVGAGLLSREESLLMRGGETEGIGPITSDGALRYLAAAIRDFGHPPQRNEYRLWRSAMLVHPDFGNHRVPSDMTLRERVGGGWSAVLDAAVRFEPEPSLPELDVNRLHETTGLPPRAGKAPSRKG